MKKLYGIVTPLTTPFQKNGALDEGALRRQVDYLIEHGIHCLYPCGTTGEMLLMTPAERMRVAEVVLGQNAGRVPVFVQVGAITTLDTIEMAKHALKAGADGIGVVTPSFFGLSQSDLERHYDQVAESVPEDFPIYLYNIPQCAGNDLLAETVKRLAAKHRNIVGIKYSQADIVRTQAYLEARPGFSVLQGHDKLPVPYLTMGCDGIVSGLSGAFPDPIVATYEAFRRGDIEAASRLQDRMREVFGVLIPGRDMACVKAVHEYLGLGTVYTRAPITDLTEGEKAELFKRIEAL